MMMPTLSSLVTPQMCHHTRDAKVGIMTNPLSVHHRIFLICHRDHNISASQSLQKQVVNERLYQHHLKNAFIATCALCSSIHQGVAFRVLEMCDLERFALTDLGLNKMADIHILEGQFWNFIHILLKIVPLKVQLTISQQWRPKLMPYGITGKGLKLITSNENNLMSV